MQKIVLPPMWRGDDWNVKVQFHRDISMYTFACQLKHSRFSTPLPVVIDTTHQNDVDDPYIVLHVDGADVAGIGDNLLAGDLEASPTQTLFEIELPVKGQYTEAVA